MTFYTTGVIYFLLIESTRMENSVQGINNSILTWGEFRRDYGIRKPYKRIFCQALEILAKNAF